MVACNDPELLERHGYPRGWKYKSVDPTILPALHRYLAMKCHEIVQDLSDTTC